MGSVCLLIKKTCFLAGTNYTKSYITYDDVVKGGILEFNMEDTPNKSWGSSEENIPALKIE